MQKKRIFLWACFLLVAALCTAFSACTKAPVPSPSQPATFSVTVNDASGSHKQTYLQGEVFSFVAASKSGYLFDGWFLDSSFTAPLPEGYVVNEEISVYAKYSLRIMVGFKTNNGTIVPAQFPSLGAPVTPPTLQKQDHLLEGWYYDEEFTKRYEGEGVTASCTLYAKWVKDTLSVTLFNGETSIEQTINYGTSIEPLANGENKIFVGWYYDSAFTQKYEGEGVTAPCTLYAAWRPEFITVTLCSAHHPMRQVTLLYGSALAEEDPTFGLYLFEGWSYQEHSPVYYEGEPITESITLHAVWKAPVTVTYFAGDGEQKTESVRFGDAFNAAAAQEDALYLFDGWFTDKAKTEAYEGDFYFEEDITLYAKWISPLAVKFISYYGGPTTTVYCKYGETVNSIDPALREMFVFRGWFTNAVLSTEYDFSAPVTKNLSLYGGWLALYAVTFYPENGDDPVEYVVKAGEKISAPEISRNFFRFEGWKTADGRNFSAESPVQKNETYYAKWYDLRIDSYPEDYMCLIGDVPMITINTDGGAPIDSKDVYIGATISLHSEMYPEWNASCHTEIRGRGNSSWWNMEKKSYRLKLENKNFNMAGLTGSKHYALIANMADKTNLRNYIAYCLGRSSETVDWSMDTRFVEVTLNGDYKGLYLLVEVIRAEKDRVNLAGTPDNELDHGFLVEQMASNRLDYTKSYAYDGAYYWEIKYPEKEDFATNEEWVEVFLDIERRLTEARNAITSTNYELFTKLCDENSYIDFWMIQDLFKNFDSFQLSIFLYKPQGGKLHYGPVWDFDIGAANCNHESVLSTTGSYTIGGSTIHGKLMQIKEFAAHYKERVKLHLETDWMYLMENISAVVTEISEANERNFERWDITWNLPYHQENYTTPATQLNFLIEWLTDRMEWFRRTYVTTGKDGTI